MKKVVNYLPITVIIIVIIISVNRCGKRNSEEKEEKQRIEAAEERRVDSIKSELFTNYSIEYDWISKLLGENGYRIEPIKTVELQELMIENNTVFFDTYIKDLTRSDNDCYLIEFGMSLKSHEILLLEDEFEISASLDKHFYDSLTTYYPEVLHAKRAKFTQSIFIIVEVESLDKERITDEDGNHLNLWRGTGKLLDFKPITTNQ
jgi:hypothetical protein